MKVIKDIASFDFEKIPIDPFWNIGDQREQKMHRIHTYPAKFPAFITTKALEYWEKNNSKLPTRIADIFCGCGTTAFEARRNSIDFWGCDINPVATLIAKTKSRKYQSSRLQNYYEKILQEYSKEKNEDCFESASERLKYWFMPQQYNALAHLKKAIYGSTPNNSDYRLFFLCGFSNILKATSRWLTKSIKPQIDPNKKASKVIDAFNEQYKMMFLANEEVEGLSNAESDIVTGNFLDDSWKIPSIDMIITSPPYVTSYEYADLHQLSSLWLGYVDDYKELRDGTIGSLHHEYNFNKELKRLNSTGLKIVLRLLDQHKSKAKSIAKYFLDMQLVAQKSFSILNNKGTVLFVIGNTEYKNIRIDNAKHLAESLINTGFSGVSVTKRKISNKILTPYRDAKGKFSSDSSGRKVYSEEFIITGRKER
ncbi:MAG: class I SAM-dependent methyltransferase [Dissulfurispiraceae bacterium]|jgi:DNA modification methylase|nr:class I SAM-dependent methyltransferase [Dissulfurispiraceae bacterium]